MNMLKRRIEASSDGLRLAMLISEPVGEPKGIVQIVHGMCEHKERYIPFMEYLSAHGYVCAIHDHRGHGETVLNEEDLGYMYKGGWRALVEDIKLVQNEIKASYPALPYTLFGHSMGSMAVRSFTKRYDDSIDTLFVCGCPSYTLAGQPDRAVQRRALPFPPSPESVVRFLQQAFRRRGLSIRMGMLRQGHSGSLPQRPLLHVHIHSQRFQESVGSDEGLLQSERLEDVEPKSSGTFHLRGRRPVPDLRQSHRQGSRPDETSRLPEHGPASLPRHAPRDPQRDGQTSSVGRHPQQARLSGSLMMLLIDLHLEF